MESKVEKLKQSRIKISILVTPEEMVKYFNTAFEHIAPTVKLDGFRPGKAPRVAIESAIGVTRIISEALDMAINETFKKAVSEHDIVPMSQPNITVEKYPNYASKAEEIKNNLEFTLEFASFPEVKIDNYSKVKVDLPKKEEVKEEDIKKILNNLQKQKSNFKEVDRGAKLGDFADLSYEGMLKKVKIDAMSSKSHPMVLGEGNLIPGFEEEVVGMKTGEEKTFKIKFPKDYHSKDYAGKEAEFKVTLNNLKEVILPEFDNAFAADFGAKTIEELKEKIKENLAHELEHKNKEQIEIAVLDKVLPKVHAEIPEEMIKEEVDRMMAGYKSQLSSMNLNFESYLQSIKKTEEEIVKEMRPTAEKSIKTGLLLGKIIEEQELDREDKEAGRKAMQYLVDKIIKNN